MMARDDGRNFARFLLSEIRRQSAATITPE